MPPNVARLLRADPTEAKAELDRTSPTQLFAPAMIASPADASLVKAALYLQHGFLDDCHEVAQQMATPNGSYWHAIMHRQEGDFGNAKYWYRRVGRHPIFAKLHPTWDPFQFVDECERGGATEMQRKEFDLLLEHTIACAAEKP